jgi:FkbM family methyltransferase
MPSGDAVVDIGANVGVFSGHAAAIVGKHGSVLSVEALPPTFHLLQWNRNALQRDNASLGAWHVVNAAVTQNDTGTRTMTFLPRAAGWGTCMPEQHIVLMKKDLKTFVRNLLEDNSSQVLILHAEIV